MRIRPKKIANRSKTTSEQVAAWDGRRICKFCGRKFKPKKRKHFCSIECRDKRREENRKRKEENRKRRNNEQDQP